MEKILILLLVAMTASGCIHETKTSSGNGVKVEAFSATDKTLTPNQQTTVEMEVTNYNDAPTELRAEDIELFNTGQLEVIEKRCTPTSIDSSQDGFSPTMRCVWTVQAPGEDFVQGFESKPLSFEASIGYASTLENSEAVKVEFQPLQEIQQSGEYSRTVGNGDIRMSLSGGTPVAVESTSTMTVNVRNIGPGDIQGDYSFEYTPGEIFSCPGSEEPIEGEVRFSCELSAGSTGTRNLFVSTSYKYEKTPGTKIEVVNK
jgi:hypothetical protein